MNSPHCAANPLSGLSYNCVTGLSYKVTDRGRVFFPEGHADRTVWHEISTGVPSQRTWTCHVVITQHREVSSILRLWEPEGLLFCCCFDGGSLWVVNIWPWARHSLLNPRILTCKMKVLDQVTSIIVQSLSHVRLFVTPWTADTRLPCPSPSLGVCSNSCPLSRWCHPTISSSVNSSPPAFNLSQLIRNF